MAEGDDKKRGGYGKRPLWQWILLYLIIAAVAYFGIYYFYIMHNASTGSGYGGSGTTQNSPY